MSTTVRQISLAVAVGTGLLLPQVAHAATLSLQLDNVGTIHSISSNSPEAAAGFLLGEAVLLQFTFDDTIADTDAAADTGLFIDPNSSVTLVGATSGATQSYFGGLQLSVEDNNALEIVGIPTSATAIDSPVLSGEIELETTGAAFFSDGNNLAAVFADLLANPFPNNAFNIASTQFFNGGSSSLGIQFGAVSASAQFSLLPTNPDPEPPTTTPEPSALIALVAALFAGSHLRKAR